MDELGVPITGAAQADVVIANASIRFLTGVAKVAG